MILLRNFVVYLLSSLFFVALITGVLTTNINIALAHPNKLEAWLNQSGLYTSVVSTAVKQAQTSAGGSSSGSNGISLSDVAVQQAAQAAFPPAMLQQDVNKFLDGNYAWLEGKVNKPNFIIDLTSAKQTFAQQVGQYVTTHLASLPLCTYAQAATMQNIDPLTVTCRPANISAIAEGAKMTQQISSGTGFLSDPVITADTISPSKNGVTEPYYTKFSIAPKIYQWAIKLPLIIFGVALISALGVVFISSRKRKGLRRIAVTLLFSGIFFIATKFGADYALKHVDKLFKNSNLGDIQQALTDFIKLVVSQIAKINLYFGIAFVILAIAIFVALIVTHNRVGKPKQAKIDAPELVDDSADKVTDTSSKTSVTSTPNPVTEATTKPTKRSKLVQ